MRFRTRNLLVTSPSPQIKSFSTLGQKPKHFPPSNTQRSQKCLSFAKKGQRDETAAKSMSKNSTSEREREREKLNCYSHSVNKRRAVPFMVITDAACNTCM
jgi:hypothetical protein